MSQQSAELQGLERQMREGSRKHAITELNGKINLWIAYKVMGGYFIILKQWNMNVKLTPFAADKIYIFYFASKFYFKYLDSGWWGEAKLGRHLILIFHVKEIPLNLLYTKEATWGTDGGGWGDSWGWTCIFNIEFHKPIKLLFLRQPQIDTIQQRPPIIVLFLRSIGILKKQTLQCWNCSFLWLSISVI